ncbi:aminoglycoside phosphotransferase family protein [Brachybacterium paraconglomeratum]|uniref:phosphotransferase n=1 Tax=Brachybacterium paraconglomeratum TaxID=173362 RepID=UPI0031ED92F8
MTTTVTPTSAASTPLELLLDHAHLHGAETLVDPARLSTLLGREVNLDRVRIKPGASVMISYRATGAEAGAGAGAGAGVAPGTAPATAGRELAEVGWAQLVRSRDKRENILRRADRTGSAVREHPRPAPPSTPPAPAAPAAPATPAMSAAEPAPYLLSGGIDSDPRLGAEIHRVLRRHQGGPAPRVLSYNPGRHAVLLLPGTGEVLRVAARPLDDLLQVVTHWRELGMPTLDQRSWRGRRAVLVGERWGDGDLAGLASHPLSMPAATRLGGVIARLHTADVSGRDLPAARIGSLLPVATRAIAGLLPHRAQRIQQLSNRLRELLPADAPRALIHGDLSPDQVLVSVDETAVPGEGRLPLRVVDLDRSGLGPVGADLGSWLASCLVAGVEEQAAAFLDGYARRRPLPAPEELAAWTARALLAAALDPLRRYGEDWLPAIEQRLVLAERVLDRPERLPLPYPASRQASHPAPVQAPAPAPAPSQAPVTAPVTAPSLVPAHVPYQGRQLTVRRAWADDGRGLPLELTDDALDGAPLRAARLDPATGEVTVFETGADPRLPGLSRVLTAHSGAVVVSHRPGKRAVVRTRDEHGAAHFVKIVRPGRAERLLAAIDRSEAFTGPFRTATVLAADEDTVTFSELPGTLLHDGLPVAGGLWRRAWRETLEAWSAAVRSSRLPSGDAGLETRTAEGRTAETRSPEVHGPEAEAAVLAAWGLRADAVDPAGAPARRRAIAAARRELGRLGEVERPALIHRDLHDKQILWTAGEAPALLDVDTATLGDPALDAANLRAHATWRELQEIWSVEQAEVVREEIDRAAAQLGIRPETLAAYESGTIARLACVYAFRPRWRETAQQLAAALAPRSTAEPGAVAESNSAAKPRPAAQSNSAAKPRPTAGRTTRPTPVGRSTLSSPAPAGDSTPLGGSATLLERSMSR